MQAQPLEIIEAAPPARQQTAMVTTPAQLLEIAVNQGADLDKLERLMALQERWEANEARREFVQAMAAFKSEPLDIFKRKQIGYTTKDGEFVGYKHAELSDVASVVVPSMARHDLSHRWEVKQEGGRIIVTCIVTHKRGHSEAVTLDGAPDNSGKKNAIQQVASAVTYLQRYTLLAATGMATKGMDDDGQGGKDEGEADLLRGFQDASLNGTAALRAHYEKVLPGDDWWAANSKALKAAAKLADAPAGAAK